MGTRILTAAAAAAVELVAGTLLHAPHLNGPTSKQDLLSGPRT